MSPIDVAIIGAGPAGLAAARPLLDAGASVALLDEQAGPGGQIWRGIRQAPAARAKLLGTDYELGRPHAAVVDDPRLDWRPGATVWRIDTDPEGITICFSVEGVGQRLQSRQLIIATGAIERPVPLPGWTLPGVLTAGAAQILLKSSGLAMPQAVLVGSGPLLYLLASQLLRAGHPPRALIETQTREDTRKAMIHLGGALRGWRYLLKGAGLLARLRLAGIERYVGVTDLALQGDLQVSGVRFRAAGRDHVLPCQQVLLHQGVVPNIQISQSLGLAHTWDDAQRCFRPVLDPLGRSSQRGVLVAGDGAAIGGARAATVAGELAALAALHDLHRLDGNTLALRTGPLRARQRLEWAARPFLDALYPPPASILRPADDTVICRCEDITAGDIRRYAALGCEGPNQTKAFGRPGMGPCQGRYCGLTVTEILAAEQGRAPEAVGYYRIRAPLKPITVGELADLAPDP